MLEDYLLKIRTLRFEMWQVLLASIFGVLALITYGALVQHAATRHAQAGPLSKAALKTAQIPQSIGEVVTALTTKSHPDLARDQRFEGQSGFSFPAGPQDDEALLVLSRFDGDLMRSTVEIVDLKSGEVLHQYAPDINELRTHAKTLEREAETRDPGLHIDVDFRPHEYGIYHPFVESDGSLIFQDSESPLFKIDACSNLQWASYGAYHHAIEKDADGHYWTMLRTYPHLVPKMRDGFDEDTIVSFSTDGEILFRRTLTEIFLDNGLEHLVYAHFPYSQDPYHINDVQPVLTDGDYWQAGDLFLNIRHLSSVVLYRPATNEIVWSKRGPWMMQHDVDILDDERIAIFDNRTAVGNKEYVVGTNQTLIYDFSTDEVSAPYTAGYRKHDIRTINQGLQHVLTNGDIFVEETNYGRLVVMDGNETIKWSYVNRAEDGMVYQLHWSRYIEGEDAVELRQRIAGGFDCSA